MARVFELRKYHAVPGKVDEVSARFRDYSAALLTKHGMDIIGFWAPVPEANEPDTFIYLLGFPSRAAAETAWAAVGNDPDWPGIKAKTEANGPLVASIESIFLDPTEYSPLK